MNPSVRKARRGAIDRAREKHYASLPETKELEFLGAVRVFKWEKRIRAYTWAYGPRRKLVLRPSFRRESIEKDKNRWQAKVKLVRWWCHFNVPGLYDTSHASSPKQALAKMEKTLQKVHDELEYLRVKAEDEELRPEVIRRLRRWIKNFPKGVKHRPNTKKFPIRCGKQIAELRWNKYSWRGFGDTEAKANADLKQYLQDELFALEN